MARFPTRLRVFLRLFSVSAVMAAVLFIAAALTVAPDELDYPSPTVGPFEAVAEKQEGKPEEDDDDGDDDDEDGEGDGGRGGGSRDTNDSRDRTDDTTSTGGYGEPPDTNDTKDSKDTHRSNDD